MKEHTKYQVISSAEKPLFVLVPFEEYMSKFYKHENITPSVEDNIYIPQEVVEMVYLESLSSLVAWRKYKKLSQATVASIMQITQPSYSQMENTEFSKLTLKTKEKIAKALELTIDHFDI